MLTNPFLKAMKIVEGTVSILDSNCVVYSRIWCVYELYKSLMGQKENYKFDIYTDFSLNSAIGIAHGIKGMEDRFPIDRILKVIDIDVVKVLDDAKFIKNAITGNGKDADPLESHPKYDELNMILKSKFVAPVIHRIIYEVKDDRKVQLCLEIFKNSRPRDIVLDFENCSRFNNDIAKRLVDSLPPTLEKLWFFSNGSGVTQDMIDSLPGMILSKLPDLLEFLYSNTNMSDDGAKQFAAIISTHSSLNHILLRKSNIGDVGAIQLRDAFKGNESIKHFEFHKLKQSDTGFFYYEIYNLHRNDDVNDQGDDGQDGVDQDDDEKEKELTNRQCIKGSAVEGEFNSFTFLYLLFKCHKFNS